MKTHMDVSATAQFNREALKLKGEKTSLLAAWASISKRMM